MSTKFSDFFKQIVAEAKSEGKDALEELIELKKAYRQKRLELLCKKDGHIPVGAQGTTHVWCDRCNKYLGTTDKVFPNKLII